MLKSMNVKNLMLLLALTGLGASCTSDEDANTGTSSTSRNEIQLVFCGASGESEEYTKAIASEQESKIDKLQVYLFAAASSSGPYYYLETWEEGTAYDPVAQTPQFKKVESGTTVKATIYPNELKGLPYLKLMCVANNGSVGNTTDGKLYTAAGVEATALIPVTTNADGSINATGTTLEDFRKMYTKLMENEESGAKDIINTPLVMTGEGSTKISGTVSKVNIDMKRIVARFDIDNTTSKSQLTIKKITLAQARKNSSLWGEQLQAFDNKEQDLMTYAPVDFENKTGANIGTTESAIYVYPGIGEDESYLIIDGTYKSPVTNEQVEVSYHVPIVKTAADGKTSSFIPILANNRYKLHITDVTQSNIYANFEVVDWTSAGGIVIKPDNDAPMLDAKGLEAVTGNAPAAIGDSETMFTVEESSVFNVKIAATGKVRAEKAVATKTAAPGWLEIAEPEYEETDGIWYSTFQMTVKEATGELPIDVTFINEAASYDPALWTTLTFYGPKAKPALEDGGEGSLGNTVDYTKMTSNMYNVVGSYIKVKAMCIEGTKLVLPEEFEEDELARTTDGYSTTFTIKVKSELTNNSEYKLKFQNTEEASAETVLTVTAVAAKLSVTLGNDASSYATLEGTTVKTDIDLLATNSYTLKIAAPQGADVTLPSDTWLTFDKKSETGGVIEYEVKLNEAVKTYDDFNLEFTNKLDASDKLTVTMKKAFSKPKFATAEQGEKSAFNEAPTITDYAPTAKMYLAKGSKIAIKVTCPESMSFLEKTTNGLTITDKGNGNYEIEVNDATAFTAGETTEVIAQNTETGAEDRNATLTITWVDPTIAVQLTDDNGGNVVASKEGDDIVYTVDLANLNNFIFTVNAPGGATTDTSVFGNDNILKFHADNTGGNNLTAGTDVAYKDRKSVV